MSDIVEPLGAGRIEPRELEQEMRSSYLDYAMSVIVGRALPDVAVGAAVVTTCAWGHSSRCTRASTGTLLRVG